MGRLMRIAVAGAVMISGAATNVFAHTLVAAADSQTNSALPTKRAGADEALSVRHSSRAALTGFVRFDLSSLPSGGAVAQATLRLWVNTLTNAGTLEVRGVLGSWNESTLSADTAPPIGLLVASKSVTRGDEGRWLAADVTSQVQDWLAGAANDGVALVGTAGLAIKIDSKENTLTSHAPEIEVVLASPVPDLSAIQAQIDGLAARVAALEQSSGGGANCHAITAVQGGGVDTPGVLVACPTGNTQFCETVPLVATDNAQAGDACVACFGAGNCTNEFGYFWFGSSPSDGSIHTSFMNAQLANGNCIGHAGEITNGWFCPQGRWAP